MQDQTAPFAAQLLAEIEQLRYQAILLMNVPDALIATDLHKRITSWNHTAETLFGWTAEEALGRQVDVLIDVTYLDATFEEVARAFNQESVWVGRTRQSRKDGTYRYLHTSVSRVVDSDGKTIGAMAIDRDITEQVQAQQALARSEELFRLMFEHNRAVQIVIDPETRALLDANQAAVDFYGYSREQLRQMKITDLNALPVGQVDDQMSKAITGEQGAFIFQHRLASGETRTIEAHPSPMELDGRTVLYSIIHDITGRIQAEEKLRESENILRAVVNASVDSIVLKDINLLYRYANPAACRMLGKDEVEIIGKTDMDLMPEAIAAAYQAFDQRIITTGQVGSGDFAAIGSNGRFWVNVVATPMFDESGQCSGVLSVIRDITERKRMETALTESERRYREIIEHQGEGVFITDAEGFINYTNAAAEVLVGVEPGSLLGGNVDQFVPVEMMPHFSKQVALLRQGRHASFELGIVRPDGQPRELFVASTPRFSEHNEFLGAINITRDITNYKQSEKKLRYDLTHDALTGVFNRTYYEEIQQALDLTGTHPLSVIMIDVDGLKSVNDQLGHPVGDLLLRRAASLISQSTRSGDLVMRIGGDEFVVFLPETTSEQVQRVRERIEQAVAAENEGRMNVFTMSLSVGCHTSLRPGALKETITLADMEMYHVKRQKKRT